MVALGKQRRALVCEFQAILCYIVRSCTKELQGKGEAEAGGRRKGGKACMECSSRSHCLASTLSMQFDICSPSGHCTLTMCYQRGPRPHTVGLHTYSSLCLLLTFTEQQEQSGMNPRVLVWLKGLAHSFRGIGGPGYGGSRSWRVQELEVPRS